MPEPQEQTGVSPSAQTPPPDLSGLRIRPTTQDTSVNPPKESTWQTIKRNLTPELDTSRSALGPGHQFDSGPSPAEQGKQEYYQAFGSPLERAYGHAKKFLQEHEQHLSEKYLAPFRTGLDRMAGDLQEAAESGHTKSGGRLTEPTRALAEGVGGLLKQVPIGRNVSETALALVTPPELGPEGKALKAGGKAAQKAESQINLEGLRVRDVSSAPNLEGLQTREVSLAPKTVAKNLPPQPRLPDSGTHAAIKTDDGSIYFDDAPEKQRTHIMLAKDLGIPPERVVSGGWLKDGEYEGNVRSDAGRWGEQARAQAAVAEKRAGRASETPSSASTQSEQASKSAAIPKLLEGLASEARKSATFEEFRNDFLRQTKHGRYYHLTENPNFTIDPKKGPRDMSSLSDGGTDTGKLMVTSDLDNWNSYYNSDENENERITRPYVAIVDMSEVPRSSYQQVNRGFGNEFFVEDPAKAKIVKVVPVAEALEDARQHHAALPNSDEELEQFYNTVKQQRTASKRDAPKKSGNKLDILHDEPEQKPKRSLADSLFADALPRLGPETSKTTSKTRLNASGDSRASLEAQSRVKSEASQNIKRFRVDVRSGKEIPLFGVDAVDAKPNNPYEKIIMRGPKGDIVLDAGSKTR